MTATKPKPPPPALALWRLIPAAVRLTLRATVPQTVQVRGRDEPGLLCAVGPGAPLRWLLVVPTGAGDELDVRLWEVRRAGTVPLAGETTTGAALPALLQRWAREYLS